MTGRNWTSASWYRVSKFRPRLRSHAQIYRHLYRGARWYVSQDRASGRFHRFTPETYRLITMMDGNRTLDEVWELAVAQLDIDAVTQDELVRLVGQLYTADVLSGDVPPDITELSERGRRTARQKLVRSVLNPLALRVPLIDPNGFLSLTMPLVRPLYSIFGLLIFLAVVGHGLVLAALNWGPLNENVVDRVLSGENFVLLLIAYPAVKALHELGHAYTIKRWGGAVHEIGVMFLVFMPVPYVDASDSIAFSSKWRRALVGGAGILVEIFLAAIAMIVWSGAEEGLIRAFAFNVMIIGGVSTLFFNGNPLLRFDGYYVLSDLLEIPNLGQRANKYVAYLVQRYAFGLKWVENPATAPREPAWFVAYAFSAYAYRLIITFAIIALVATRFFFIGVILAIWALFLMLILPVLKGIWFLFNNPALRYHRGRALLITGGVVASVIAGLLTLPVPHNTMAEGVVMPIPEAFANATAEGVIVEVFVTPGMNVKSGTPLIRIEDPLILARRTVLEAWIGEIEQRRAATAPFDQIAVEILEEELFAADANLNLIDERIAEQQIYAKTDGRVILPEASDLVGRFARRGELLTVVAGFSDPIVRVVVPEAQADLVQNETLATEVRFASNKEIVYRAQIVQSTPSLIRRLPSLALSTQGGGQFALDPGAQRGQAITLAPFLQLDLKLQSQPTIISYGDRVIVRFSHGDSPLIGRIYRATTRIFLKYFATT